MGGDAESLWLAGGLARTEKAGERCGSRCLFAPSALEESPWAHLHVVGMLQFMSNINQTSLPTPFYSVLASISAFMALSTVFHSIILPTTLCFLTLFFQSYLSLNGPFN